MLDQKMPKYVRSKLVCSSLFDSSPLCNLLADLISCCYILTTGVAPVLTRFHDFVMCTGLYWAFSIGFARPQFRYVAE